MTVPDDRTMSPCREWDVGWSGRNIISTQNSSRYYQRHGKLWNKVSYVEKYAVRDMVQAMLPSCKFTKQGVYMNCLCVILSSLRHMAPHDQPEATLVRPSDMF